MHPILYSRIVERKHQDPRVRIVSLQTFTNRSTDEPADVVVIFKPHTDLALANAMAHVLVKEGLVNREFVARHVVFKKGLAGNWGTGRIPPLADPAQLDHADRHTRRKRVHREPRRRVRHGTLHAEAHAASTVRVRGDGHDELPPQ
jgi:anaerobic selenocysteine-containing dehydrogenase